MTRTRGQQTADAVVKAHDLTIQAELDKKVDELNQTLRRAFKLGLASVIKTRKATPLVGGYKLVSVELLRPVKPLFEEDGQ